MNTASSRRAVVIGAGLGGLAAALRLAHRGWRVTVCERHETVGGKMNRWTAAGFTFDTGPSLVTMPFVFEELFADVGERLSDHVELLPVEPLAEYVYPDGVRFVHTTKMPDWLPVVRSLEGGTAEGFFRFLALGARLYELSKATFFGGSPRERPAPGSWRALKHMPLRHAWGSYARTVDHFFKSPHLRQLFNRYMTYVGSSPWETPATLSVIPAIEFLYGGWHARGGLYRIVEAIAALATARGVEIRTSAPVARIDHENGRVRGVRLADGEGLEANAVVYDGDDSRLPGLLGLAPAPSARPERERSMSGLVFLFALRRTREGAPHHRVFFSADYRREFRELFEERRFPTDPTVYVNMPSRTDRSMTPGEGEVMFAMANAPANDGDAWDEAMVGDARARVIRRLRDSGFPAFEDDVVASAVRTPRWMADHYDMPGGSIYGAVSHGWRGAFWRAPNRDRRLGGLYNVGGSGHPGGGTPTVLLSARITAELVERHG